VKKGDQEVGSAINAWGLLGRGLKGIDRNRRASKSLSPTLALFFEPNGNLSLNRQLVLSQQ
jgi:hypothetical protein